MAVFNLSVNLIKVHHCLSLNSNELIGPANDFKEVELLIEWKVFQDEIFPTKLKELLAENGLIDHYDNLLYILYNAYHEVWTGIQQHIDNYESQHRARELARMLLLLKDTPRHKLDIVIFKSYKEISKITDTNLTTWISETLIKAIEQGKFPLNMFGINVMEMLSDQLPPQENLPINLDKLEAVKKKQFQNWKKHIKTGKFRICLPIFLYLQNETGLKAAEGINFSDAQLEFLFNLLQLLKQIHIDQIQSKPKDYMRSGMVNLLGL